MGMYENKILCLSERRWLRALVCLVLLLGLRMDVSATALGGTENINDGNQVNVDISWGEMKFTYTDAHQLWDPTAHEYSRDVPAQWDAEDNWITITNSGERTMKAELTVKMLVGGVTGKFLETENAETGTDTYTRAFDKAETETIWFELQGAIDTTYEKLGEIIITIIAQ